MPRSEKPVPSPERARRIRLAIKMTGFSNKQFGKKNAISLSTLNTWVYGSTTHFPEKAVDRILRALSKSGVHTSSLWILTGYGMQPHRSNMPYATASHSTKTGSDKQLAYDENKIFHDEIQFFCDHHPDAVTFIVPDKGMEPAYQYEDCVGGKFMRGNEIEKIIGQDCIVKTKQGYILCRRIAAGTKKGYFNLYVMNPNAAVDLPIMQNVPVEAAAPIIRVWRFSRPPGENVTK